MLKSINDITVDEVSQASKENAEKYVDRAKKIAEQAFIEGGMWTQKTYNTTRPC